MGVVGVAPNVEVFIARVFSSNGLFHSSDMVTAMEACRDGGADVINMSLGGQFSSSQEQETLKKFFEEDNIVAVAATGNTGRFENYYPAAYDYVLGVGAVDSDGDYASFSTRNNKIDVAAPGVRVVRQSICFLLSCIRMKIHFLTMHLSLF
jgi:serine protease